MKEEGDWAHTTWEQIDLAAGDFREGFVQVYLEFRGAILDDEPLDAKGRPAVVNQSNFAKHMGISASTFSRWLGEFGDGTEGLTTKDSRTDTAKGASGKKATKKDKDILAADVRRKVASARQDFVDKIAVHSADHSMWLLDAQILEQWEAPVTQKVAIMQKWLETMDQEIHSLEMTKERLLVTLSEIEATDGTAVA